MVSFIRLQKSLAIAYHLWETPLKKISRIKIRLRGKICFEFPSIVHWRSAEMAKELSKWSVLFNYHVLLFFKLNLMYAKLYIENALNVNVVNVVCSYRIWSDITVNFQTFIMANHIICWLLLQLDITYYSSIKHIQLISPTSLHYKFND